ncbi:response regulator transcription factor [Sphingobacterium sp. E70]|uniref:winged helix-turn-helix domain-containing protein n=1 Tax=Sphingobacterium sp. E70 TaxID=2853439 RepID=UPI00211CD6D1|nr:response regulator transcription factor [Sphingobacterium sp. E70]ULT26790.1 response regulator transcription factor [Sphingobacterium sp. E70]
MVRRDSYKNTSHVNDSCIEIRDLKVDLDRYEVYKGGENVDLSPKEFKLFKYLIENRNKTLSRTAILQAVWGIDFDNNTNVVDVYVSYLRGKWMMEVIHPLSGRSKGRLHAQNGLTMNLKIRLTLFLPWSSRSFLDLRRWSFTGYSIILPNGI